MEKIIDKESLKNISQDKEFIKKLLCQETNADFKAVLEEKGINMSLEDVKDIRTKLRAALSGEVSLTDEELDIINGGGGKTIGDALIYVCKSVIVTALVVEAAMLTSDIYSSAKKGDKKHRSYNSKIFGDGYGKFVDYIAGGYGGVKENDNKKNEGLKKLSGDHEDSEDIVKGFGIKNGKLF